ncbi:hypothetical protein RFI_12515, partial [Reticulomyxa filosa]
TKGYRFTKLHEEIFLLLDLKKKVKREFNIIILIYLRQNYSKYWKLTNRHNIFVQFSANNYCNKPSKLGFLAQLGKKMINKATSLTRLASEKSQPMNVLGLDTTQDSMNTWQHSGRRRPPELAKSLQDYSTRERNTKLNQEREFRKEDKRREGKKKCFLRPLSVRQNKNTDKKYLKKNYNYLICRQWEKYMAKNKTSIDSWLNDSYTRYCSHFPTLTIQKKKKKKRFIKWLKSTYGDNHTESRLPKVLEECCQQFKHEKKYYNFDKYLRIWLEYVRSDELCSEGSHFASSSNFFKKIIIVATHNVNSWGNQSKKKKKKKKKKKTDKHTRGET